MMPIVTNQAEAIDHVVFQAARLGYSPGAVWRDCPVLTSNGAEHWAQVALAVFDDPIRRGVPEHCCIGLQVRSGDVESAFRLLRDCGAWTQFVVRDRDWSWRPEPESLTQGPHPLAELPEIFDRERTRLLPSAIMHQKRNRQGYLFDHIFPITHRKLVQVFENAVLAGWHELTENQKRQQNALEKLCATALRILCLQVFNHRDVLERVPEIGISGPRRSARTYRELHQRMCDLPAHLGGLRSYMQAWKRGEFGLDTENAIFCALSQDNEYDFACLTPDMLGPFYQAALMRNPATGDIDKEKRKKHGIFYTSRRITQLVLDRLPIEELAPDERFLLDPTCGSGSFLMAGEQRLAELIRPRRLSDAEKAAKASGFIQGNDRDQFAVLVAQLQLVLHKPDSECQYHFQEVDIEFDPSTGASIGVPYVKRPSIIVGNPPFLRHGNVEESAALFFHAAVKDWLADGGLLGFVLPATFLSGAGRCRIVREAILESCELLEAWDLPRNVLSDEKDGNGGTNGGDIESCVVLLRKRKPSQDLVSFCRVFSVNRNAEARKLFRHKGLFSSHGLCNPAEDWEPLPGSRWWASALAPALRRLGESPQCITLKDICRVTNGIKQAPEKPEEATSPPSPEHVPWLQTARGMRAFSLSVWHHGVLSQYIRYPGKMNRTRLKWARRDSNTGEDLGEDEWRKKGIFAGRKILIHKNADPASTRPLRALIDVGHFPSSSFHFAWLDPRLPDRGSWTYEALLAILNAPVSQVWLALARTINNPTDVIESIPVPRLDRESIRAISREVSSILALNASDSERRTQRLDSLDRRILELYPLSQSERDLLSAAVHGTERQEDRPLWNDAPWPVHGVVEAIREADESGPATVRIRLPEFRRGAQVYDGPIPPEMPGWVMVAGIEFQAEVPWPDAEASVFDPMKIQRFRPLPFAHEVSGRNVNGQAKRVKKS